MFYKRSLKITYKHLFKRLLSKLCSFLILLLICLSAALDLPASEVEEAQAILNQVEVLKEKAQKDYAVTIKEMADSVKKVQDGSDYKSSAKWIQENQNQIFAKQSQPLPTIDYVASNSDNSPSPNTKDAVTELLSNYRFKPQEIKQNQIINYPLMIFVSASIPKSSLKDLMTQARQAGGILVFRGMIGNLRNTVDFLAAINKENVSAIIDPRLFEIFNVKLVPTFVLLAKNVQDCTISCNFTPTHDRITGNVTLHYALEQFAEGDGVAKENAKKLLSEIKNKISGDDVLGGQK